MSGTLHAEADSGICTLTIENTGKRNALSPSILRAIEEEVTTAERRDDTRALVITGSGDRAFSSGYDISEFEAADGDEGGRAFEDAVTSIYEFPYPTIAMINGDTYGGAMELIAVCDLRIAVEDASFAVTPAKLGLVYGDRGINQLMHHIGPANVQELLFTAKSIDADRAGEIGLLNHVVDASNLEDRTYEIASEISTNAPKSLRGMKQVVRALLNKRSLNETEKQFVQRLRDDTRESEDHREGVRAFSEGRKPTFNDE
ncbi:Enoyl-CoA hydratase/carnithine racemase [Natronorubrum sediminis]|uniref:Enoyl-CoA hydratase/carnithine racemase n=1 Tax=Natronorubrum sediminis TaxID=640943 RepID=A0A1H6G7E7_9EURY|nr:enoyl-CoA hydratase-related protein [Natronorubrum sediminis]SEH17805.1 Enoyl-CoA hydratase/carnithine racemase [Natronorubrum sediminis]